MTTSFTTGILPKQLIVFDISRATIESGKIEPALANAKTLISSLERLEQSYGAVSFSISGYDTDPRALPEIDEVRAYFTVLLKAFPYWFHLLNRIDESLKLLYTLTTKEKPVIIRGPLGQVGTPIEFVEFSAFINLHLAWLQSLYDELEYPEEKIEQRFSTTINYYETLLD